MISYLLQVEYEGSSFSGWQRQPCVRTVQAELERILARLLRQPVKTESAARTDKGVHARAQAVSVTLPSAGPLSGRQLLAALNALLPRDIVVVRIKTIAGAFNARYAARKKTYQYIIWNAAARPVLLRGHAWHVAVPLDCAIMRSAARNLEGRHDFSAFAAAAGTQTNKLVCMEPVRITRRGNVITVQVTADRFLYRMVRNIVGTLCAAGSGKIPPAHVAEILASRQRRNAGQTAPAEGLFLARVWW
jgi:tRNA pseudouridine38-40 synthase